MKKRVRSLFLLLLALLMLPVGSLAAGSIDLSREGKLTISYRDGTTPLAGAEFSAYLVATADASGELTKTEVFRSFNVDIRGKNDDAWKALATTLEGYVLRDNITPDDSGTTEKNGCLYLPTAGKKLTLGLYLVLGKAHTQNGVRYDAAPFMVTVPASDTANNEWLYDVIVSPKFEKTEQAPATVTRKVMKIWDDAGSEASRPQSVTVTLFKDGDAVESRVLSADNNWEYTWNDLDGNARYTVVEEACDGYTVRVEREGITFTVTNTVIPKQPEVFPHPIGPITTPTPTAAPDKPSLPRTGQLWWPVPILVLAGLALIVIGLVRRRRSGDDA